IPSTRWNLPRGSPGQRCNLSGAETESVVRSGLEGRRLPSRDSSSNTVRTPFAHVESCAPRTSPLSSVMSYSSAAGSRHAHVEPTGPVELPGVPVQPLPWQLQYSLDYG